ncbi:MAG TPA: TetR family transcriptional regulator [Kineosporiaceae bacterium]|nr:TetR family transcriptional regulator [Kineosporiaceae bacterium]
MAVTPPTERPANADSLRERKKRVTRTALIDAALRLVAERGLTQVTVEEISAAANVSVRTFFNYFRNKEDAVTGGGFITGERVTTMLRDAPPELSAMAAVRRAMLAEAQAVEENPAELVRLLSIADQTPSLKPQLIAAGEAVQRDLAAAVGERTGLDSSTDGYPGLVAAVSVAAFRHAVFRWHEGGQAHSLTELMDEDFGHLAVGLPDPA